MTKNEILKLINYLGLDYDEFCVVSTSSLVIRGVEGIIAHDIDILVTPDAFLKLDKFNPKYLDQGWYQITDDIEVLVEDKSNWNYQEYEGLLLQDINSLYEYYKNSNREKDKYKVGLIEGYLREQK